GRGRGVARRPRATPRRLPPGHPAALPAGVVVRRDRPAPRTVPERRPHAVAAGAGAAQAGDGDDDMTSPDSTQPDEHYAARLAARDEALARGQETPEDDVPDDLRRRLDGEVPFLKLVRDALSPSTPLQALACFQIRRVLGRGGYGLVYVAFDPRLGRDVALKVPRADALVTPQLRERFYREARAAAVLEHPN